MKRKINPESYKNKERIFKTSLVRKWIRVSPVMGNNVCIATHPSSRAVFTGLSLLRWPAKEIINNLTQMFCPICTNHTIFESSRNP